MKVVIIAVLLLIIAFIYFSRQKYLEIPKEEKEDFKNITVHRFDECYQHNYNI